MYIVYRYSWWKYIKIHKSCIIYIQKYVYRMVRLRKEIRLGKYFVFISTVRKKKCIFNKCIGENKFKYLFSIFFLWWRTDWRKKGYATNGKGNGNFCTFWYGKCICVCRTSHFVYIENKIGVSIDRLFEVSFYFYFLRWWR